MDTIEYTPQGVCSRKIIINVNNGIIDDIKVIGGCPGNSLGIRALIIGKPIDEVIDKLQGIRCGSKQTSCPDQITRALKEYKIKKDSE